MYDQSSNTMSLNLGQLEDKEKDNVKAIFHEALDQDVMKTLFVLRFSIMNIMVFLLQLFKDRAYLLEVMRIYVVDDEDINSPFYIRGTDKARTPDLRDFCFIICCSYICLK